MIDIVLPELSIALDDLHPDVEDLHLIPAVALSCLAIHGQIQQTGLEVPKDNDKGTESASVHDEVVDQLVLTQGLVQRDLVEALLEPGVPEAVEAVDFGDIVVLGGCGDMKIDLGIELVVVVNNGTG